RWRGGAGSALAPRQARPPPPCRRRCRATRRVQRAWSRVLEAALDQPAERLEGVAPAGPAPAEGELGAAGRGEQQQAEDALAVHRSRPERDPDLAAERLGE